MKINYKLFSKHAEKVAKSASASRPMLKGIEHRDDGTLTVTDSRRLYRAYNVNAPRNVVLDAVSGDEIDAGTYPNCDNLVPGSDGDVILRAGNVDHLKGVLKAMQAAGKAVGYKTADVNVKILGNRIVLADGKADGISFDYELTEVNGGETELTMNLQYLLESVEMFSDMKAVDLTFHIYGNTRPMIVKHDEQLVAIVLPLRPH